MESYRKALVVAGLALVLIVIGPMSSSAQQERLLALKVAYMPIANDLPIMAAMYKDYFKEKGLKVESVPMIGGAAIMPAIAGGSIDVGTSAYISVITARDKGFDYVVLVNSNQENPKGSTSVVVLDDSPIRTAKDLEGRSLGVNTRANVAWLYGMEWLSLKGTNPAKVTWVELPFPKMSSALRGKKLDAVINVEPFVTFEKAQGGVRIIGSIFVEVTPRLELAGYVTRAAWAKNNKALVDRFVRAVKKAMDYANQASAEAQAEILAKYTRLNAKTIKAMNMPTFLYPPDMKNLQQQVNLSYKWGLISKKFDAKAIMWPTALQK